MKEAIDDLLQKHRGDKEMLKLVDQEYAAIVHRAAAADPNSLLHPTTRLHISRYVKHLVKLLNTSSSLNISPEKLRDTQPLWHSLTDGSESSHVPVVTVEPATFNPPAPALSSPLTQHSLEKIVQGILSKQQQQQQLPPGQKKRQRCVFPVDSQSLDMKLMDPRSTFSINRGLCGIFTAHKRCTRAMLLKDSLTLKCPLRTFQPLTFFRENWMQPRREWSKR
ncbi:putative LOC107373520-like protein [Nothobranchius furzeri]|uniref:LOC107373520-like protein n=1 Tax=Nothobranchius furzeri TaxID=105023 RepID=A0A9D3BPJ0_NOTFU|nr:putative LOC107373520-like protein [Nothobranchius furzeri]